MEGKVWKISSTLYQILNRYKTKDNLDFREACWNQHVIQVQLQTCTLPWNSEIPVKNSVKAQGSVIGAILKYSIFEGQPELKLPLQEVSGACLEARRWVQDRYILGRTNMGWDVGHCSYMANSDLLMTGPESTHLFQLNHQKGVGKCNGTHTSPTLFAFILQT